MEFQATGADLKRLSVSGAVVGQSAIDAVVNAPGVKIGFEPRVDSLRVALVKPHIQLFQPAAA
jgi:hypothetical protein